MIAAAVIDRILMIVVGAMLAGVALTALLWYLDQAFARKIAALEQTLKEINPRDLP